jgi:hypothetical protein
MFISPPFDDFVKSRNQTAKKKDPDARRANQVGIRRQRKKIQMQGAQILRNEAYIKVRCNDEGYSATQPFGFAQGREHVERQMDFLRSRHPLGQRFTTA